MESDLIFWPVIVQILIVIAGFMLLGIRKKQALKNGQVDLKKAALDNDAWPDEVLKVSNNIRNQFQVPVLFYVLCFMFYALDAVTIANLSLAWVFVLSRVIHAYVHMSSNFVPARFSVFTLGFVVMVLMLIQLASILSAA
jgi:hypothetical protein